MQIPSRLLGPIHLTTFSTYCTSDTLPNMVPARVKGLAYLNLMQLRNNVLENLPDQTLKVERCQLSHRNSLHKGSVGRRGLAVSEVVFCPVFFHSEYHDNLIFLGPCTDPRGTCFRVETESKMVLKTPPVPISSAYLPPSPIYLQSGIHQHSHVQAFGPRFSTGRGRETAPKLQGQGSRPCFSHPSATLLGQP